MREIEFFIDNLLVRIHFIIVMMRWTGLAPYSEGWWLVGQEEEEEEEEEEEGSSGDEDGEGPVRSRVTRARFISAFENNYFAEMCSGSEAVSY